MENHTQYKHKFNFTQGYIALISVVIVSALMLMVAIGLSLRSVSDLELSSAGESAARARALANACAEEAIVKLKGNLSYLGNETIIVDGGDSCTIVAVLGSGNTNRTIETQAVVNTYVKKIQVIILLLRPTLTISSWAEVPDF